MGKLFVVGIGPGGPDGMTIAARRALEAADIVVGYTKYVELALAAVPDAAHLATPMMHEVERCRLALSRAQSGEAVALVCSGDAGVYGMASPVLDLAEDYPDVDVEVIAGATAAQSGSAVLGAPLAHDFAVVSLSDLRSDVLARDGALGNRNLHLTGRDRLLAVVDINSGTGDKRRGELLLARHVGTDAGDMRTGAHP